MKVNGKKLMSPAAARRAAAGVAIGALVAVTGLAGTGGALAQTTPASGKATGVVPSIRALLPADIRKSGVVEVGTDPTSAPYDFFDKNNKLVGLEQDLATAMGRVLGITFHFNAAQFPSIIPAIQSGRWQLGMAGFGDFAPREKVVNEIDYETEATGIVVPQGNPLGIKRLQDFCGHSIAVVQGSIPQQLAEEAAKTCKAGKSMSVLAFPNQAAADLAARSQRADGSLDTYGVAVYTLAHAPQEKLEVLSFKRYAVGYQAIVVSKKTPQLRNAIVAALNELKKDGAYRAIFAKWGLSANMLAKITVNDAKKYTNYLGL